MANFKLGFIGAGFIARFQTQALTMVRGADLAGVHAPKGAEDLSALSRRLGVGECVVHEDIASLCNAVDAVLIFAPNFARVEIMQTIADAVSAGAPIKGIVSEKPLGRTVAEAKQLLDIAASTGLPTAYFENQLHMKGMNAQKRQLVPQERAMGPLTLARSAEEHAGPHEGWFWDPTRQGGGVLSDMGCHSIAIGWYVLTPAGKPVDFLEPVAVTADLALLKWGQPTYRKRLLDTMGVDYAKTPAEDFATGMVTFRNPETGQLVKAQFTNSWMFDKQGLRVYMDGLGPGYAFEFNTLQTPLQVFIGDEAAEAAADVETALEKSTASRGLLAVETNEPDLYGYVDELEDAVRCFSEGHDAKLNFAYGYQVTRLCQAAYLSAELGRVVDLTDPATDAKLEHYTSLIAQGRGGEVLHVM